MKSEKVNDFTMIEQSKSLKYHLIKDIDKILEIDNLIDRHIDIHFYFYIPMHFVCKGIWDIIKLQSNYFMNSCQLPTCI